MCIPLGVIRQSSIINLTQAHCSLTEDRRTLPGIGLGHKLLVSYMNPRGRNHYCEQRRHGLAKTLPREGLEPIFFAAGKPIFFAATTCTISCAQSNLSQLIASSTYRIVPDPPPHAASAKHCPLKLEPAIASVSQSSTTSRFSHIIPAIARMC